MIRRLQAIAHVRTGDKGDTSQISVIAFKTDDFPVLLREVTCERVRAHFPGLALRSIERFELPGIAALNFVLEGALMGGVTRSLALDAHGKTLGAQLLTLEIDE